MAGADTFRGCSFQAAYSVGLALDVLEGAAATLVLEGDADVVDAAMEDVGGAILIVTQVKTKIEPYVWAPQEIADVIRHWLETKPAAARFEFVTDGSFGPAVSTKLRPALDRISEGTPTEDDRKYLRSLGLDPASPALKRISLRSRLPEGRALLERTSLRVMELRERIATVTAEEARDLVWRLFGETVLGSGETDASLRRLGRDAIADLVGVPVGVIDDAEPWSEGAEQQYREALASVATHPAGTVLELLALPPAPALALVEERRDDTDFTIPQAAVKLLDRSDDVLLTGTAGSGKTTTLAQLRAEALERGLLPIQLRLSSYLPHMLERLLRRSVETLLDRPLAPGVVARLLAREDVIVVIDGAGELPAIQRAAFLEDLAALRLQHTGARLLLAARDPAVVTGVRLTGFQLQALDAAQRRQIGAELAPGRDDLVDEIEARLGDLLRNPLLFTMALGLGLQGIRPETRAALFEAFNSALQGREEGRVLTPAARAGAEVCGYDLRIEGRFNAEPWWWLDHLAAAREAGIRDGTLLPDTPAAEELLGDLRACGLVSPVGDGVELGFLHDLFCDWLASEAVARRRCKLPNPVPELLDETVVFLAERDLLDEERLLAVAGNVVAAGRAADVLPPAGTDAAAVEFLWERLREQLPSEVNGRLAGARVRLGDGDPPLVWLAPPEGPSAGAADAAVVCVAVPPASPLTVAVDLFLAVVRLEILHLRASERPPRPATTQDELARAIAEAVTLRATAIEELVAGLVPALLDRILDVAGRRGVRGWVLPAVEQPGFPGSGDIIVEHPFHYTSVADGVRIDTTVPPGVARAEHITTAENYLRDAPRAAALKIVRDGLTTLIPRFDD